MYKADGHDNNTNDNNTDDNDNNSNDEAILTIMAITRTPIIAITITTTRIMIIMYNIE